MNWKEIYDKVLTNVCEKEHTGDIVELPEPSFTNKLIENENADSNALYRFKLDETKATDKDYEEFSRYIYNYIGLDIDDFIEDNKNKDFDSDDSF